MSIKKTGDFTKEFEKLSSQIRKLFQSQESIFKINWLDPRLHTKRVKELSGAYSFRITRRYRVLFYFRDDMAVFFAIGHRKDIYE